MYKSIQNYISYVFFLQLCHTKITQEFEKINAGSKFQDIVDDSQLAYSISTIKQQTLDFAQEVLTIEKDKKYALVFGNEVFGVSQEAIAVCDGCIEIPQLGTKHSLNISVSAGIVVWDLFKKFKN